VDGEPIVIIRIENKLFAIGDICTHNGGPLGDGDIEDHFITCPRHGTVFDLITGEATTLPAVESTNSYPIRIKNNMIEVGIPLKK